MKRSLEYEHEYRDRYYSSHKLQMSLSFQNRSLTILSGPHHTAHHHSHSPPTKVSTETNGYVRDNLVWERDQLLHIAKNRFLFHKTDDHDFVFMHFPSLLGFLPACGQCSIHHPPPNSSNPARLSQLHNSIALSNPVGSLRAPRPASASAILLSSARRCLLR